MSAPDQYKLLILRIVKIMTRVALFWLPLRGMARSCLGLGRGVKNGELLPFSQLALVDDANHLL
eukprot:scaffold232077_cov17-Tisochrysis_lutea.AAC.1